MTPPLLAFDTETHISLRGRAISRMVCLTLAGQGGVPDWMPKGAVVRASPARWKALLGRPEAIQALPHVLNWDGLLVAHNAAYDLLVLGEFWRTWWAHLPFPERGSWAWETIFTRLAAGTVADTQLREQLVRLALGEFEFYTSARGMKKTAYSLDAVARRYFGDGYLPADQKVKIDTLSPGEPLPHSVITTAPEFPWRLRFWQLDGVPIASWPIEAEDYATGDAVVALDVYLAQTSEAVPETVDGHSLRQGHVITGETREVAASVSLGLMASWGWRTDLERTEETVATWHAAREEGIRIATEAGWLRDFRGRLRGHGSKTGKPGSMATKRVQAAVVAACTTGGIDIPMSKPSKTFPQGQVRTGEEQLREAGTAMAKAMGADPEDHPLVKFANTKRYAGFDVKYSGALRSGTKYALTSRPRTLVETGRTAWADPPLQQCPPEMRPPFTAREGTLLASTDYDAVELRTWAQVCLWEELGDTMAKAFQAGKDVHTLTGVSILNVEGAKAPSGGTWDYDLFAECRGRAHGDEWRAIVQDARKRAKVANFGFLGGMGARGMASQGDMTEGEAALLRYAWLRTWPEAQNYLDMISAMSRYGNFTARQFVSGRVRGGLEYTNGANTYFQGLAADGVKTAAVLIAREAYTGRYTQPGDLGLPNPMDMPWLASDAGAALLKAPLLDGPNSSVLLGARPTLLLHDEILAEVLSEKAHDQAWRIRHLMLYGMQAHTPDIPITATPALMTYWDKYAETLTTDNGRLKPWN